MYLGDRSSLNFQVISLCASMAETPKKLLKSPRNSKKSTPLSHSNLKNSSPLTPKTPQASTPVRRSARSASLLFNSTTPQKPSLDVAGADEAAVLPRKSVKTQRKSRSAQVSNNPCGNRSAESGKRRKPKNEGQSSKHGVERDGTAFESEVCFSPVSPDQFKEKKRKRDAVSKVVTRAMSAKRVKFGKDTVNGVGKKKRTYYKKVNYDGAEFEVGDDVYVRRREDASSDEEVPDVEECRVCFDSGDDVMIECDDCLGGFHLKCLKPPLTEVPEGDWICAFCEGHKLGKKVQPPAPPKGKKIVRTLRERLLSSDLWAVHIESIWKEADGIFWCRARWYLIPEETVAGRQPHNLKRELYRTNDVSDIEMETIIRHCYVFTPKEYAKANNDGDDVFLCEYEYDIHWHSFKRLAEIDSREDGEADDSDEDWNSSKEVDSDTDEDVECEEEMKDPQARHGVAHILAANSRKGQLFGLQKIGTKRIPEHVRCHKLTDLERAKATLMLSTLPKSLPCRNKEMEEISAFIKGAICDDHCLGRCLYIHGVPGTGKTMTVLSVMKSLRSEVETGNLKPHCFVEINGLKLATAENIYRVIYEALTGHRVSWKKALQLLNERFSEGKKIGKDDDRPCILLIDELDLLVTRNQSVLYNLLDWPTKPHSKLVVIGIANTMDLPEKLLPRISSRMGIQRLCFGPYNYQQLQEIISTRLKGIEAFDKQAVEFASRKVAAISGDARRALEICRRAAEIADYNIKKTSSVAISASAGKRLVRMTEVEAAIQEMFQAPHIQVMKNCSKLTKIFLTAMVYELYKTGMGEVTFEQLAATVSCICTSNGEAFPGWDVLLKVGCKLGECRIILCEPGARHRLQKLQLNFPSDDVAFALKDNKELPWLAKYI